MEILEIKGITKYFGGLVALEGVDINIRQNEIVGLIGPNGSGKTTLLNIITGFLQPTKGEIIWKGKAITGLKPYNITQQGIARTFQLTSLFPNLTVEKNIIAGRHLKISTDTLASFFRTKCYREENRKLKQKAAELLAFMDMEEQRDTLAKNLPFGDQTKLEIAIALATEPKLLLLDEPAAGMNAQEQLRLVNLVRLILQQGVEAIIIIDHNMRLIMEVCSSIVVLNNGCKLAEGFPEEVARNEQVVSVYLGESLSRLG